MSDGWAFFAGTAIMVMFFGWLTFMFLMFGRLMESRWRHKRLMQAEQHRFDEARRAGELPPPKAEWPLRTQQLIDRMK